MKKDFPGIRLISTDQHSGATQETAKTVSENLLNRFGAQANGIFACNESAATGMLLALRDAGLAGGKVKFVAFDSSAVAQRRTDEGRNPGPRRAEPDEHGLSGDENRGSRTLRAKVETPDRHRGGLPHQGEFRRSCDGRHRPPALREV